MVLPEVPEWFGMFDVCILTLKSGREETTLNSSV